MSVPLPKRLFTVAEYYKMAEAGILGEDDRVELIEGEVVGMSPIGSRHAACVKRLSALFFERASERVMVSVQDPVRLGEHSEPQPDLALLKPRPDFYAQGHPRPEDILLLVEVAETSAGYDREVKLPLYARSAITEVWLVDLDAERIEVYRQPSPQGYQDAQRVGRGERVALVTFPDLELAVEAVLG